MPALKADIIARLQKEILPLQGFKSFSHSLAVDTGLGPVKHAFPDKTFPLGAVHEFICSQPGQVAATSGFISGILASLMKQAGAAIWIRMNKDKSYPVRISPIFPPALTLYGIDPASIIFIDLHNEKDVLWVMEEALKCNGLAAVVGEVQEISFTASRRLQLAVEESRVTGFLLRNQPRNPGSTACLTRWEINSLPGIIEEDMPGVGYPCWNVALTKVRNGKPGSWEIMWTSGSFRPVFKPASLVHGEQKKVG